MTIRGISSIAFALSLASCGGRYKEHGSYGGTAIDPDSGSCGNFSIVAEGPDPGYVTQGSKSVVFLVVKATMPCGTVSLEGLTFYIHSETPTTFWTIDQAYWNFYNPRLISGPTGTDQTSFFEGVRMDADGSEAIRATFEQPMLIPENEPINFEFLADVATEEPLPGSLVGQRFRASIYSITGLVQPDRWMFQQTSIRGGYQTVVRPSP
jgi:hypothetical protein